MFSAMARRIGVNILKHVGFIVSLQVAFSFGPMQKLRKRLKMTGLEIHIREEILTFLGGQKYWSETERHSYNKVGKHNR